MISKLADVKSEVIGEETDIAQFSVVAAGARIGARCRVGTHVSIADDVEIGNGVNIGDGVRIFAGARIMDGAVIAANAVVQAGVALGENAVVQAGAVVAQSVSANAIVGCAAAAVVGYAGTLGETKGETLGARPRKKTESDLSPVAGVRIFNFPVIIDPRGNLTVGEFEKQIPFLPRRYFIVSDVPNSEVRGEHAHRKCHQFLICIKGRSSVIADDGATRQEILLDHPSKGVYLPPMVWATEYKYSPDAALLVFASDNYDPGDYIRSYAEFKTLISGRHPT
jgi:UDP-2-acetamido-3-amino-2,3-dideoxy-glucuronate N-acetyltransferase